MLGSIVLNTDTDRANIANIGISMSKHDRASWGQGAQAITFVLWWYFGNPSIKANQGSIRG